MPLGVSGYSLSNVVTECQDTRHIGINPRPGSSMTSVVFKVMWCVVLLTGVCQSTRLSARGRIVGCPVLCRCLEKGSIMTCRHSGLSQLPNLLSTTMFLDFDHNHLSSIRNGTFVNASRIEMLSLQDNQIRNIESGTLSELSQLHTLLLGYNLLSSLSEDLFTNNPRLEILDLHHNAFVAIPDSALRPLRSLRVFNLSYNYLESAQLGPGFSFTTQLSVLDLSGNNFISLEPKVFKVLRSWSEDVEHALNLSGCNIHHIHRQTLRSLLHLDTLSLAGNPWITPKELNLSIQDLTSSRLRHISLSAMNISDIYEFFANFQHPGLLGLDLSYNRIQSVGRGTFYHLVRITDLDLSHNQIRSVDGLSTLTQLRHLDLSHNQLHFLDPMWLESLHSLEQLDVSHNALTQLDDGPFQNLFYLQRLDISSNKISRLTIRSSLESLNTLIAHDNILTDLSFVCRLRQLTYLDVSRNHVTEITPRLLARGQHFIKVNLSGNALYRLDRQAFGDSSQSVVDLSYNRLSSLSYAGWNDVTSLVLDHNSLYNVTPDSFRGLSSLRDLRLDHNQFVAFSRHTFLDLPSLGVLDLGYNPLGMFLELDRAADVIGLSSLHRLEYLGLANIGLHRLCPDLIANLTSLRHLDLSSNRLQTVDGATFAHLRHLDTLNLANNYITYINPLVFYQLDSLRLVDLAYNDLHCTCDLMPFRSWAISTLSDDVDVELLNLPDADSYRCRSPPEWRAVPLINFHLDATWCSARDRMVLSGSVASVFLALVLAVVIAVLRYRWWRRRKEIGRTTIREYTFVDDSSTATLTGNQTLNSNNTKDWL